MTVDKENSPPSITASVRMLLKRKKYSEALAECEDAEAEGMDSSDLATAHSAALLGLKRYGVAEDFIRRKLLKFPSEDKLNYNLVVLKVRLHKYDEAITVCDDAEARGLRTGKIAAARAIVLIKQYRYKEAIDLLNSAIREFPGEGYLHYWLGIAFWRTSRLRNAREEFKEAAEIDDSLVKPVEKQRKLVLALFALLIAYFAIGMLAFRHTNLFILPFMILVAVALAYETFSRLKAGRTGKAAATAAGFVLVCTLIVLVIGF